MRKLPWQYCLLCDKWFSGIIALTTHVRNDDDNNSLERARFRSTTENILKTPTYQRPICCCISTTFLNLLGIRAHRRFHSTHTRVQYVNGKHTKRNDEKNRMKRRVEMKREKKKPSTRIHLISHFFCYLQRILRFRTYLWSSREWPCKHTHTSA